MICTSSSLYIYVCMYILPAHVKISHRLLFFYFLFNFFLHDSFFIHKVHVKCPLFINYFSLKRNQIPYGIMHTIHVYVSTCVYIYMCMHACMSAMRFYFDNTLWINQESKSREQLTKMSHIKLRNINLHNITHSLISPNPREWMFVVQISFLIVTFRSLISRNLSLMQTTKEVNLNPCIAPCVNRWSVFFFFFFLCHLLNVGACVHHIAKEGQVQWTTLAHVTGECIQNALTLLYVIPWCHMLH